MVDRTVNKSPDVGDQSLESLPVICPSKELPTRREILREVERQLARKRINIPRVRLVLAEALCFARADRLSSAVRKTDLELAERAKQAIAKLTAGAREALVLHRELTTAERAVDDALRAPYVALLEHLTGDFILATLASRADFIGQQGRRVRPWYASLTRRLTQAGVDRARRNTLLNAIGVNPLPKHQR